MIREHYAAVRALIPGTVNVYAWNVPDSPAYPYVVIWGSLGSDTSGGPDGESLDDVPDVLTLNVRATYAGLTGDSMLIVARNVRAALNRQAPAVTGWAPSKLRLTPLTDAQTDTSVTIPGAGNPVFAVDEYALVSSRI